MLPRAPSSEMENLKKEEELEHMRQQLHALGEQRDKERQATASAEKLKLERENKKLKAQIEVRMSISAVIHTVVHLSALQVKVNKQWLN